MRAKLQFQKWNEKVNHKNNTYIDKNKRTYMYLGCFILISLLDMRNIMTYETP
jgi:hypothetical protein